MTPKRVTTRFIIAGALALVPTATTADTARRPPLPMLNTRAEAVMLRQDGKPTTLISPTVTSAKDVDQAQAQQTQQQLEAARALLNEAREVNYQQSKTLIAKDRQLEQLTAQIQALASAIDKAGKGIAQDKDGQSLVLVDKPKPAPASPPAEKPATDKPAAPAPKKDGGK